MPRILTLLLALGLLAACGKKPEPGVDAAAAAASAPASLLISPEDLVTVGTRAGASGPIITGSVEPERRADLRAEVSAVVRDVLKENGDPVRAGELLVRLDDSALREALASADESVRAASQAFEQTERQVQRQKTLREQGMTSMQALEDAEIRRNNAQSDLVAARARAATARQQLRRLEVRAPFDGVASDRRASPGDTAQVGKELLKVIDPRSMRFEGLVSADRMQEIRAGQKVAFRVNGVAQADYTGVVRRVDAAANATTRQVSVTVGFADAAAAPRMAGLFAEGRIDTGGAPVLVVPEASVQRNGEQATAWRVKDGKLAKVALQLGERDSRRGEYPVRGGLVEGDRILRTPVGALADGQKVELAAPVGAAATAAASTPAPGR
jgi:membrane fusion protein, multidrug efflux system